MARPVLIAYWDTSALVKLYVEEPGSVEMRLHAADIERRVTAVFTYAELRAALAGMQRGRRLSVADLDRAKHAWESDWLKMGRIDLGLGACVEAGAMAEQYALRGCDSLHLACFAHLVRTTQEEVAFYCYDRDLAAAAAQWRSAWLRGA